MRVRRSRRSPTFKTGNRPGFLAAALAALALLVQGLIPGAVMAREAGGALTVALCTAEGLKTITIDSKGGDGGAPVKDLMGPHCAACLAATVAIVAEPDGLLVQPVRYAARAPAFTPDNQRPPARARAPPRPPGQGPPTYPTV